MVQHPMRADSTGSGGSGRALRSLPPVLIIALAGWAAGFALAVAPQLPGSALTMGLGLATLVVLPGFLVIAATHLPAGKYPWTIITLSFIIGLGIIFGLCLLPNGLGLTYRMTMLVINMVCLSLCAVLFAQWRMGVLANFKFANRSRSEKQADWLVLALALALVGVQVYATLPGRDFRASEDLFVYGRHITTELARKPALLPMFNTFLNRITMRKGWLIIFIIIASHLNVTSVDMLWRFAPPALIVMSLASVYSLACEAFERPAARVAAVLAHTLFVLTTLPVYARYVGFLTIFRLSEDKVMLSLVIIPILIQLLMAYLRTYNRRILIEIGIGVIVAIIIHPLALPFIAVTFFSVTALTLLATPSRKLSKGVIIIGAVALLASPFAVMPLLYKYKGFFNPFTLQSLPPSDPNNRLLYNVILVLSTKDNNYIVKPIFASYPFTFIGLLAGLIAGIARPRNAGARMLAGLTGALLLVMFTPYLTPTIGLIVPPFFLQRFSWLFPVGLSLGWGLTEASRWAHRRLARFRGIVSRLALVTLTLTLWAGSGISGSLIDTVMFLGIPYRSETRIEVATWIARDAFERVDVGSVVLVKPDTWQGEALFALAPNVRVVPPFRTNDTKLLQQVKKFYQPGPLNARDIDFIRKYNIDYVIMPASMPLSGGKIVPGMTLIIRYPKGDALYQINLP